VSEYILNGTSAQLAHTVLFTLVHAAKYRTADKSKTNTVQKLNRTQKKQTTQNTAEQNYPGSVARYDTQQGNEVNLFHKAPERIRASQSDHHKNKPMNL